MVSCQLCGVQTTGVPTLTILSVTKWNVKLVVGSKTLHWYDLGGKAYMHRTGICYDSMAH